MKYDRVELRVTHTQMARAFQVNIQAKQEGSSLAPSLVVGDLRLHVPRSMAVGLAATGVVQ